MNLWAIEALKLALIPFSILAATLVSRRFGHAIGGIVSGLPLIAGPIVAILLIDHDAQFVASIALATLIAIPAALAHITTFAWASRRFAWPICLLAAAASFFAFGSLITSTNVSASHSAGAGSSESVAMAIAILAPPLALAVMPRAAKLTGGVAVPNTELLFRMAFAVLLGALIIQGSNHLSPRASGLLLAWPITGSILPCFTLPLHGHQATVNLLRGFANGLFGFVTFFACLFWLLGVLDSKWLAFALAFFAAAIAAFCLHRTVR